VADCRHIWQRHQPKRGIMAAPTCVLVTTLRTATFLQAQRMRTMPHLVPSSGRGRTSRSGLSFQQILRPCRCWGMGLVPVLALTVMSVLSGEAKAQSSNGLPPCARKEFLKVFGTATSACCETQGCAALRLKGSIFWGCDPNEQCCRNLEIDKGCSYSISCYCYYNSRLNLI
jgi:hypothetical protein